MKKNKYIIVILLIIALSFFAFYTVVGKSMVSNFVSSRADNTGNIDFKIELYNISLKIDMENANARNQLIDVYIEQNMQEKALLLINDGLKYNENNSSLYFSKIKIYENTGQIQKAIDFVNSIENNYILSKFPKKESMKPVVNKKSGTYDEIITIEMQTTDETTIYYKINGSNYEKYIGPFDLDDGYYTINAVAFNENFNISDVVTYEYNIENMLVPVSFSSSEIKILMDTQMKEGGLSELTVVDLSHEKLENDDINSLVNCAFLEELKLGDITNVTDITPLLKIKTLEKISIQSGCSYDVFEQIMTISSIKEIRILNSNIYRIPQNKTLVSKLVLKNCLISDISNLKEYKTLEYLDLSTNILMDIESISYLLKLEYLNLSNNKINDLSSLRTLIGLSEINLSNNSIIDTDAIAKMTFIEKIDISHNQIASVKAFVYLRYLNYLNISFNNILTLEPFVENTNIQEIHASNNYITSIDYVSKIENLNYLNVENNNIY